MIYAEDVLFKELNDHIIREEILGRIAQTIPEDNLKRKLLRTEMLRSAAAAIIVIKKIDKENSV